jgi:hypothetical protein
MKISDRNIIKAIEVHTIMASEGAVIMRPKSLSFYSVSPNHYSILKLFQETGLGGKYCGDYTLVSYDGTLRPYLKAKNNIEIFTDKGQLVFQTDFGRSRLNPCTTMKAPPLIEPKMKTVKTWKLKVGLSKLLGTKNYKRPKTTVKYLSIDGDNLSVLGKEMRFPDLGFSGQVKASTLLQILEVAWRASKIGKMGYSDGYIVVKNEGNFDYEAYVPVI